MYFKDQMIYVAPKVCELLETKESCIFDNNTSLCTLVEKPIMGCSGRFLNKHACFYQTE